MPFFCTPTLNIGYGTGFTRQRHNDRGGAWSNATSSREHEGFGGSLQPQSENSRQLESHLCDFIQAYNFARRLKTLNGLTPCEYALNGEIK
jgi:hypothetical protein